MRLQHNPTLSAYHLPLLWMSVFFLAFSVTLNSQILERQLISTTGHLSQTDELLVSATAGETIIQTAITAQIILTQGFQQPTEADFVGVWNVDEVAIDFTVAPNPATTTIYVTLISDTPLDLNLAVFDMQGVMVVAPRAIQVSGKCIEKIDFSLLAAGTYLLRLKDAEGKSVQTFKIIKQW